MLHPLCHFLSAFPFLLLKLVGLCALIFPCCLATSTELTLSLLASSSLTWRWNTHISSPSVRRLIRDCCQLLRSIIDEPTNHLDMHSNDALAKAIEGDLLCHMTSVPCQMASIPPGRWRSVLLSHVLVP